MQKKQLAILMMFIAYAILLGHNIIPHHHHDNLHELNEHHATDHHHNGEHQDKNLSHLLSHFIHSADVFTITVTHNLSSIFSKQQFSFVALMPDNYAFCEALVPPEVHKPPAGQLVFLSPHTFSLGLRAPPTTFI